MQTLDYQTPPKPARQSSRKIVSMYVTAMSCVSVIGVPTGIGLAAYEHQLELNPGYRSGGWGFSICGAMVLANLKVAVIGTVAWCMGERRRSIAAAIVWSIACLAAAGWWVTRFGLTI